jgi:hypothetical protein
MQMVGRAGKNCSLKADDGQPFLEPTAVLDQQNN